jgi:SAM-dependent methyltransferase
MPDNFDPVLTTARSYEDGADSWREHAVSDRSAWQPSYDRFLPLVVAGERVLDLGCGSGLDAPALSQAGRRVVGLDVSRRLLQSARGQASIAGRLLQGDLRALPFADASFDGVWADGSMHHVARGEVQAAIREVARVLKVGGGFMASVERGDGQGLRDHLDGIEGPRWYARYEPDEWRMLLRKAGFIFVDALMGASTDDTSDGFIVIFARKL